MLRQCAGDWEVCFEGDSLPGASGPASALWDNPIDDAWPALSFRQTEVALNQSEAGDQYVAMRRPAPGPSWFLWRDTNLTPATGWEARVRIRTLPVSDPRAVVLVYSDSRSLFSVLFDADGLGFHPGLPLTNPTTDAGARLPTTWDGGFEDVIVRQLPTTGPAPGEVQLLRLQQGSYVRVLASRALFPRHVPGFAREANFNLGDPSSNLLGHFDLSSFRLRRLVHDGGFELPNAPSPRPQPPSFRFLACAEAADAGECSAATNASYPALDPPGAPTVVATCRSYDRTSAPDSGVCLAGRAYTGSALTAGYLRAFDQQFSHESGATLEWVFRLLPNFGSLPDGGSADARVHLSVLEEHSTMLVLSRTSVRACAYARPVCSPPVPISLTGAGPHVVRLARPPGSLYADVYVDGQPVLRGLKTGYTDYLHELATVFGAHLAPLTPEDAWALPGTAPVPTHDRAAVEWLAVRFGVGGYAP